VTSNIKSFLQRVSSISAAIFVVYLMRLTVAFTIARNGRMITENNELRRMWKKEDVA
jgi:hypothetical protein